MFTSIDMFVSAFTIIIIPDNHANIPPPSNTTYATKYRGGDAVSESV